jgi:hypothetical protein
VAAVASLLRGGKYHHAEESESLRIERAKPVGAMVGRV